MNMNFFDWLRDGVRQSVIQGVSDAVEQIGTPDHSQSIHPDVAALLQEMPQRTAASKPGSPVQGRVAATGSTSGRKRLGKSLQELNPTEK